MPDLYSLVVGVPIHLGMLPRRIHERLGAEQYRGNAAIFEGQCIVQPARHTGPSVPDADDDEIALPG